MGKFKIEEFTGVIPALLTVFDENENIDEKRTRGFINHLIEKGIDGLYLTGSTGEGFLMSLEERKKVVEIIIDEVSGRIPIMVHIGAIGTKNSIELAKHAYEAGADAISSVPPFYWNFKEEHIYNYYKDIAEATSLPMIVYNVPLAGILGFESIKRLASIEGVKGIKYTATTHHQIGMIKDQIGEDFIVYSGCDEMAASGLMNGADGIIGSFYNLMPELFIEINNAIQSNDLATAKAKQKTAIQIIDYSLGYDYFSVMRLALKWMGIDAGYSRRPFNNISGAEEEKLKIGFKELKEKYKITGVDFLEEL
ncbi:N-acetylneuraminate lyase [Clostridium sediminicola]|uniref:dihydrodipicolinate synthase family protein n=1 Tax=Clostridium sediminicola TaxID=3114879 RepID=UPI0031F20D1B